MISEIYAAAVDPTRWREVAEVLADAAGAQALALSAEALTGGQARILAAAGLPRQAGASYERRFAVQNPWRAAQLGLRPGQLLPDQHLDPFRPCNGVLHETSFFREWMAPLGFQHAMGAQLLTRGPLAFHLMIYRGRPTPFSRREARQMEPVAQHLAQALDISHRLDLLHLELQASRLTLSQVGVPVLFVTRDCEVTFQTATAGELLASGRLMRLEGNRLRAADPAHAAGLEELLAHTIAASRGETAAAPCSLALPDAQQPQLTITAIPVAARTRLEDRGKTSVVLLLQAAGADPPIPLRHLEQRYGLNDREARLVRHLIQGLSLRETAEAMRVAYETARWYLKSVYRKTNTCRQADLVRLVLQDLAAALTAADSGPNLAGGASAPRAPSPGPKIS